jgi:hypothetical protein
MENQIQRPDTDDPEATDNVDLDAARELFAAEVLSSPGTRAASQGAVSNVHAAFWMQQLDANGNGYISAAELNTALRTKTPTPKSEVATKLIELGYNLRATSGPKANNRALVVGSVICVWRSLRKVTGHFRLSQFSLFRVSLYCCRWMQNAGGWLHGCRCTERSRHHRCRRRAAPVAPHIVLQ